MKTKNLDKPHLLINVFILTIFLIFIGDAFSQTSEPILRIETKMHTAQIKRIGTDAANRFLVTASNDKTARVWNLTSGELLQVLRPPIGDGNEGKLYVAAMSPDGNLLASGGWISDESENNKLIYIYEHRSGKMLKRLPDLPNVTRQLVFSPDGKYLAATLGGGGARLYKTVKWTNIRRDTEYGIQTAMERILIIIREIPSVQAGGSATERLTLTARSMNFPVLKTARSSLTLQPENKFRSKTNHGATVRSPKP